MSVGWWCRVAAGGRRGLDHEASALPGPECPAWIAGVIGIAQLPRHLCCEAEVLCQAPVSQ